MMDMPLNPKKPVLQDLKKNILLKEYCFILHESFLGVRKIVLNTYN